MKTYTVSQLAGILQRSRSSAGNLITSGRIQAFDASPEGVQRQWRVTEDALQEFIKKNSARPPAKRKRTAAKPIRQWV
jgi:hypothetical protein